MKIRKSASFLFVTLLWSVFLSFLPMTTASAEENFFIEANAAFAIEADSGKILYNQDGDSPLGIASVTKILSMYLVLEEVSKGKITMDDQVGISEYAAYLSSIKDFSNVPLSQGQTYSVRELYHASMIESANAAVVALAEHIVGSETAFIDMMLAKLQSWGITDATLVTSSGLSASDVGLENSYPGSVEGQENMMSAKDVALVTYHLINEHPEILEASKIINEVFSHGTETETEMTNWNWLLPGHLNTKDGVDGLKTGTTDFAGACFVGTIERDGVRLITVVLGATNDETNIAARFTETDRLMEYCYANWQLREILVANKEIPNLTTLAVPYGKELTVPIALKSNVTTWLRNDMNPENINIIPTFDNTLVTDGEIAAPVQQDMPVGLATIQVVEEDLGYIVNAPVLTTEIVATKEVKKVNFFVRLWRNIKKFFSNLFGMILPSTLLTIKE
ncbi:D-alanyl-D-alanine carboxypeptidase (penicillin-binding protein 5/6) [Enterococcus sp. PF1-24]|uniref:serine hydrolase n=1 Tax=unclassified Enterococcus TaxID=2608891 RepID=UPI00247396A4|nr:MULTISPECIES: serine hydrolase [unclassified Enterococcus]MDH6365540.1 D-alanyl-D-alanine carboxypeptidase (penicillin-binding protein 5/6) [Enterococcus sp. PFB1-1]MDH6402641.1 D-alanyl-D-alanine carboxypeptidase (penicillin-binding protein 5/6) [Enterococcus sp. PF1-24]